MSWVGTAADLWLLGSASTPVPKSLLIWKKEVGLDLWDPEKTGLIGETGAALMPAQYRFPG